MNSVIHEVSWHKIFIPRLKIDYSMWKVHFLRECVILLNNPFYFRFKKKDWRRPQPFRKNNKSFENTLTLSIYSIWLARFCCSPKDNLEIEHSKTAWDEKEEFLWKKHLLSFVRKPSCFHKTAKAPAYTNSFPSNVFLNCVSYYILRIKYKLP